MVGASHEPGIRNYNASALQILAYRILNLYVLGYFKCITEFTEIIFESAYIHPIYPLYAHLGIIIEMMSRDSICIYNILIFRKLTIRTCVYAYMPSPGLHFHI